MRSELSLLLLAAILVGLSWSTADAQVEFCDGIDNDDDGLADEGFPCVAGEESDCLAPSAVAGRQACSVACTWTTCRPTAEVCDGLDNDEDSVADEGFECAVSTEAACADGRGSQLCLSNCRFGPCVVRELCNHLDDDSDGRTDENLPYRTTVATVEPFELETRTRLFDGMVCSDERTLGLVQSYSGVSTILFDSDGHRVGENSPICHRPDLDVRADQVWHLLDANPTGGLGLLVHDHFLVTCIGWPDSDDYVEGHAPHLLLYVVAFDGAVSGPVLQVQPHRVDGDLLSPGAADLELVDEGVLVVWAETAGPRGRNQPVAPVFMRSQLLDFDGRPIGAVNDLATEVVGDTRASYRVRRDEAGPVLFVREPASADAAGGWTSFWKYRLDPLSGVLSDRRETIAHTMRLDLIERVSAGWAAIVQEGVAGNLEVGLWEDEGNLRWPKTGARQGQFQPLGRQRGLAVGDEFIYSNGTWHVSRIGAGGALSGVNRARPVEPPPDFHFPAWEPATDAGCVAPSGNARSVVVYVRDGAGLDPESPRYIQFTEMGCE